MGQGERKREKKTGNSIRQFLPIVLIIINGPDSTVYRMDQVSDLGQWSQEIPVNLARTTGYHSFTAHTDHLSLLIFPADQSKTLSHTYITITPVTL